MSERNKKKKDRDSERENDSCWSLVPSCESFRRGSKHGSVCLLWELREMCLCESVLSSGSACLWMFVCGDVLLVGACIHYLCVSVCVWGGQQFLSSLWGSCVQAKCPAAHRCLFTGWFTELTGKTHTYTQTHALHRNNSHKKKNPATYKVGFHSLWSNFICSVC